MAKTRAPKSKAKTSRSLPPKVDVSNPPKSSAQKLNEELQRFVTDLQTLFSLPVSKKYTKWVLDEAPFDAQLLNMSSLYRASRQGYLALGGTYSTRVCSTMRSLSAQDLFADQIEYTPILSELSWFADHHMELPDPYAMMNAISIYHSISVYHEQNHRILWRLLPPAPDEQADLRRYLNFAESLVVTLDLALGDELGAEYSAIFERVKTIYRPGGEHRWHQKSRQEYRQYLLMLMYVTYLELELIEPDDVPQAVQYVFPRKKKMAHEALSRGRELSELFTLNTNQQWQQRNWQKAKESLERMHKGSEETPLYLPEDPLDFEEEFVIANQIFDQFGI